jgi:FemAB-related protein (PEP-CTERM system-associated)
MNAAGLRLVSNVPVTVRADASVEVTDAYVRSHRVGSSYHRRRWTDVIRRAFKHDTIYLTAEAEGETVGVLPLVFFNSRLFGRFTVSMPFVNYGGVLADGADAARALLARAIDETKRRGGSHVELRHDRQQFPALTPKRHKVAMELRLAESAEAQWHALDRKVRNQIRKAEKSSLVTEQGGAELLPSFYEVFARNMRDLGTPVYGANFFREVLAAFPEHSRVFVVRHEGRPVAASLIHWYGSRVEVPWASSLREANPLCANVYLYWEMLRFATGRQFQVFDFGRSTPGEGTYHFKKQWGADARELVWEYWLSEGHALPQMNPKNPKFSLAIRTWQRLPVGIANTLGPHIVRHIP